VHQLGLNPQSPIASQTLEVLVAEPNTYKVIKCVDDIGNTSREILRLLIKFYSGPNIPRNGEKLGMSNLDFPAVHLLTEIVFTQQLFATEHNTIILSITPLQP